MSIRPIDYQIVVNNTGELTKDASLIRSRTDIQQFHFSAEAQRQRIRDEQRVRSTTKPEHKKIDEKQQGSQEGSSSGYKKGRDFKERGDEPNQGSRLNNFQGIKIDIRI